MPLFGKKTTEPEPTPSPARRRSLFSSLRPESKTATQAATGPVQDDRRRSVIGSNHSPTEHGNGSGVAAARGTALHDARQGVLDASGREKEAEAKVKAAEMALKEARLAVRAAVKRVEVAERENRINHRKLEQERKEIAGLSKTTAAMDKHHK